MKLLAFLLAAGALHAQLPLKQDPKDVVAIVDGRNVTREEVNQILYVAGPQFVTKFQANPQIALHEWFLKEDLGKKGAALKLDQQSPLKEQIEALRMEMLAGAFINYEMNTYRPSREEIQKFYDANKGRYQRVRVSGVYIKHKPVDNGGQTAADLAAMAMAALSAGQTARTQEEARTLALDIARRLKAGEDMGKLAEEYSEDPASKAQRGDIGFVKSTDGKFPDEFKRAALALPKGAVSDPIAVTSGFYILRADERSELSVVEATPEIEEELKKTHLDTYMKELNARLSPKILDPALVVQPVGAPKR